VSLVNVDVAYNCRTLARESVFIVFVCRLLAVPPELPVENVFIDEANHDSSRDAYHEFRHRL
jgi:hypothetical protein